MFEENLISETVLRELMLEIESLNYCIRNNKIPPSENFDVLSKTNFIQKIFHLFFKKSVFNNNRLKRLTQKIEFYSAIAKGSFAVTESINHLAKLNMTLHETVVVCQNFFDERWKNAKLRLEHILQKHSIESDYISEKILTRAAISTENKAIEELALNGAISKQIKINLKCDIDGENLLEKPIS